MSNGRSTARGDRPAAVAGNLALDGRLTGGGSPFAGLDVLATAGWASRPGVSRPCFEDDVWDLRIVQGRPRQAAGSDLVWDFTTVHDPRWRDVVKELMIAFLAPGHPAVATLARAYRSPLALTTCASRRNMVTEWLNWLTGQNVRSLHEVTQEHCERYLSARSQIYDRQARPVRQTSASRKRGLVVAVADLDTYGDLFSSDRYEPGFRPWKGLPPARIAGQQYTAENTTQPVPDVILRPLLAACLFIVEELGPHIVALHQRVHERPDSTTRPARHRSTGPHPTAADIARALHEHRRDGEPLVELPEHQVQLRLHSGWDPGDPLLRVSFQALANRAGGRAFRSRYLQGSLRLLAEQTLAAVGLAMPWARGAATVLRAGTQQPVAWTEPLHTRQVLHLAEIARHAGLTVIAALSGMRSSELGELLPGCRHTTSTGPGLIRYHLAGKVIKGQPLGGLDDDWIVIEPVHRAVGLAEQLLHPAQPGQPLFSRIGYNGRYTHSLRPWINGPAGQRLGLATIPDGQVSARGLRRTLAMELAYRPGGLLATKIHLRHVSVVSTEGYASRPGGAQARLLAEIRDHEDQRNLSLVLAEFRNYQQGILPAGPGARDLTSFFSHVDTQLTAHQAGSPQVKPSDREILNLLSKRAATLHPATANYCWFADPAKALCLKLAGTPDAVKPLAGMCDSARCPQATHHQSHRPVWIDNIATTSAFTAALPRSQAGERRRLQAETDRAQKVVDDIDAAAEPATPSRQS